MNKVLIPRFSTGAALERLVHLQNELLRGIPAEDLVVLHFGSAIPNPTGGTAPTDQDLSRWRDGVIEAMGNVRPESTKAQALHSMRLGQAIADVIDPSPSDAAHDGAWSYLSLMMFPDVLADRWPSRQEGGELACDRWIGRQAGRDRNYLKLAWRRWQVLGPVMQASGDPFGEDIFGALLERSAVARNTRLIRFAAEAVAAYRGSLGRMEFTRALMLGLTALTGPLQLDVLTDDELRTVVIETAQGVTPDAFDQRQAYAAGASKPEGVDTHTRLMEGRH